MSNTTVAKPSWRRRVLLADSDNAGANLSWGAVFAGVLTALASLVALSMIAVAIGLGVPDVTSDQPFEGLGTGLLIWAVLALVISLFAGGLVTGLFAGRAGFLHGVVVWAVGLLLTVVLTATAVSSALGAVGNVLGAAGSALTQGAEQVGELAGDAIDGATDVVAEEFSGVDVDADVEEILAGTDVPELQPEYLAEQAEAAQDDVVAAGGELLNDPENYEAILDDLAGTLSERAENITSEIDRDAVAQSVAQNTDLSEEEAEQATDQAVEAAQAAADELAEQFENAQATLAEARADVEQAIEDARVAVEDATNAAARAALWGFVAVLIGLGVAGASAHWGAQLLPAGRRENAAQLD